MENAADALEMAGVVLIFVLALSVSILSLGQARQATDALLDYSDRETVYINGDYYYEAENTERNVSLETVIPAIYRAYKEQYKIVFDFQESNPDPIYTCKYTSGQADVDRFELDSEFDNQLIPAADSNNGSKVFLNAILYGDRSTEFNNWYNNSSSSRTIELPLKNLYDRLKNAKSIIEYLGVYYQQEVAEVGSTEDTNSTREEVPDANKTEKRIITYVINK